MTGTVTRVFLTKGYGFILGHDGEAYFLHATDCSPNERWERMHEGVSVEFEPTETGAKQNKLRAKDVRIVRSANGPAV